MAWTLKIGQLNIKFRTTKDGALGTKFNSGKKGATMKYYVPAETTKEVPKYNPKNPQKDFYDVRYGENKLRREDIVAKYYDKENASVYLSQTEMARMYPLTKEAKVISKQPISKLNLKNVSASDGYYLLPYQEFQNINAYKKALEYIGADFVVTSPMRLRVRSVKAHNYAIFVDKKQNALVAMEVLVKEGMQPAPTI